MKKYIYFFAVLFTSTPIFAQQDVIFSTRIDKDTLRIGEAFTIEFVLEGASFNDVYTPDFKGFEVIHGPYQSMETQIINGEVYQRIAYGFRLRALEAGNMMIQPATAQVKGETVSIDPVYLYVLNEKIDPNFAPRKEMSPFDFAFPPTPTPEKRSKKKLKTIRI